MILTNQSKQTKIIENLNKEFQKSAAAKDPAQSIVQLK